MIKILTIKEFKNILLSPKFSVTFLMTSILILLSLFIGIQEYNIKQVQFETGNKMAAQQLSERTHWGGANTQIFREPNPMQIFVSGVSNDIGRFSNISEYDPVKLRKSMYSDDPVFAVFRSIDLVFIIQVVLSLLAILFTYDSINGEREDGTLKLVLANAIPRWKYLFAKFSGAWLGLIVPLSIPLLIGLLLLMVYNIPIQPMAARLSLLIVMGLLYYTFFIGIGLLISALTRNSSSSFLFLLVFWVVAVLIVPRIGTMAAGQIVPTISQSEIESQIEQFANQQWQKHEDYLKDVWKERNLETDGLSAEERQAYKDEKMWQWMEEDDNARNAMQKEISEYSRRAKEKMVNQKSEQENLGFNLARISPAATFMLSAMNLAGTDVHLKNRYEKDLDTYKESFTDFTNKKAKESGDSGGIRITMDSESGMSIKMADMKKTLDTSDMPRFVNLPRRMATVLSQTIIDFGILSTMILLTLGASFLAFVRYDVR
ncbi:MAG: DUF3526 domain-containing protein [Calditrichaeota bacterium]|nr:MAG: DUF3526 domain-containing protein [Calditrichota bacterium]MBL1207301.1 DUF3526 domain-containing protein [Calditrichota bacterium]NOG47133.1 ABC transporter permease subunit [Calditrichota bacterium]